MARKCQDVYEEPIIFRNDDKFIIRVFRPILTEEERAKRMKRIHDSAAALLKDQMRRESEKRRSITNEAVKA